MISLLAVLCRVRNDDSEIRLRVAVCWSIRWPWSIFVQLHIAGHIGYTLLRPPQTAITGLAFGQFVAEPFFPSCMSRNTERQDLNVLVKLLAALCIGKKLSLFLSSHFSYFMP